MDPAAADRVAGLHAAVDAAGLSFGADPVTRRHAGALDAALVALLLEHPAAATGDAALLIALKAARRKGGADRLTAAAVLGVAAGGAGAVEGETLTVGRARLEVAVVAAQRARLADLGAALAEQAVGVAGSPSR